MGWLIKKMTEELQEQNSKVSDVVYVEDNKVRATLIVVL